MNNDAGNQNALAKAHPAPLMERSKASGFQIYLIAAFVLGVMALAAFQYFTCKVCY